MKKFRSLLKRRESIRESVAQQRRTTKQCVSGAKPCDVDANIADFDLASANVREISVGCWLDLPKIRWGRYKDRETAILHLKIEACQPSDFEVTQFQVQLTFSKSAVDVDSSQATADPEGRTTVDSEFRDVFLHGRPAPSSVGDNSNTEWNFSGHRPTPRGGVAEAARWIWLALNPDFPVTACGNLHCGVIVSHNGPANPILIHYKIEGRAREKSSIYKRHYCFSTSNLPVQPWLLRPLAADEELSDDDITKLNEVVLSKYVADRHYYVANLSPWPGILPASPHVYGPAVVGDTATLIQGDVALCGGWSENKQNA